MSSECPLHVQNYPVPLHSRNNYTDRCKKKQKQAKKVLHGPKRWLPLRDKIGMRYAITPNDRHECHGNGGKNVTFDHKLNHAGQRKLCRVILGQFLADIAQSRTPRKRSKPRCLPVAELCKCWLLQTTITVAGGDFGVTGQTYIGVPQFGSGESRNRQGREKKITRIFTS